MRLGRMVFVISFIHSLMYIQSYELLKRIASGTVEWDDFVISWFTYSYFSPLHVIEVSKVIVCWMILFLSIILLVNVHLTFETFQGGQCKCTLDILTF